MNCFNKQLHTQIVFNYASTAILFAGKNRLQAESLRIYGLKDF